MLYVDTSAAMKLLVLEPESDETARYLAQGDELVSSLLLHTELHCAAGRRGEIDRRAVQALLETITLVDVTRGDLMAAAAHSPLRSNDAIHLAVAVRLGADELITFDRELRDAAARVGVRVASPGLGA